MPDAVNHPKHYQGKGGLEPVDVTEAFDLSFHLGNANKYICRAGKKGDPAEDLSKAIWYIVRELRHKYKCVATVSEGGEVTLHKTAEQFAVDIVGLMKDEVSKT